MASSAFQKCSLVILVVVMISFGLALDIRSAHESFCFPLQTTFVEPDLKWIKSVEKWYIPISSLLDLYTPARDLLQNDYADIPEYSLYYDGCTEWTVNDKGFGATGFGGRKTFINMTPVSPGVVATQSEWPEGISGKVYTTLTDNSTFFFHATCHSQDLMGWHIFSTTKVVPESTVELVYNHAKELGYREKFFTKVRYDTCP